MSNSIPIKQEIPYSGSFPRPKTKGKPLPPAEKMRMEKAFGYDLSNVRIHCCPAYASVCKAIGSKAYAIGNDIVFGGAPDLFTAAHEAAHIVQQQTRGLDANPSDRKKAQPVVDCMLKKYQVVTKSPHR